MKVKLEGKIKEIRADGICMVEVKHKGKAKEIPCRLGGKLRYNRITVIEGDKVLIELTPHDAGYGKIIYRLR